MTAQEHGMSHDVLFHDLASYESPHPLDLHPSIPPQDFIRTAIALQAAYEIIRDFQPDMVFYAQRGGGPLRWAVEALAEHDRQRLPSHELVIGSATYANDVLKGIGPTPMQKKDIVENDVAHLINTGTKLQRVVFFDEVQTGATWSQATVLLRKSIASRMPEARLLSIGISDGKKNSAMVPSLQKILATYTVPPPTFHTIPLMRVAEYPPMSRTEVALFLNTGYFPTDRQSLLDRLLIPKDVPHERVHRMIMVARNQKAQQFMQVMLEGVVHYPRELQAAASLFVSSWKTYRHEEGATPEKEASLLQRVKNTQVHALYQTLHTLVFSDLPMHKTLDKVIEKRCRWIEGLSRGLTTMPQVVPLETT